MEIIKTSIEGLVIIQPKVFEDERGCFMESYKESCISENFPDLHFIQDNESKSSYGVLRGLHFQKPPFEQTKLVRVIQGEVLDVTVDLRENSPTYGKWKSILLSGENKKQFFIPKKFAHGFLVLSKEAIFSYKVDNLYKPGFEDGINCFDFSLAIDWRIPLEKIKRTVKDINLPALMVDIFIQKIIINEHQRIQKKNLK